MQSFVSQQAIAVRNALRPVAVSRGGYNSRMDHTDAADLLLPAAASQTDRPFNPRQPDHSTLDTQTIQP
jgi:hypothetical protein